MAVLGIDLGGTKLATARFSNEGKLLLKEVVSLDKRTGRDVGSMIVDQVKKNLKQEPSCSAIGISVPGINRRKTGTVWAPNIGGWEDYPLLEEVKSIAGIPVNIESDRVCSILGEQWQGNARNCRDVIFLSVGTGIGAGILVDGNILHGNRDIAGAIGWMALDKPFQDKYISCGCFEHYASGDGIAKLAHEILASDSKYSGPLRDVDITAHHIFEAADSDALARKVIDECIVHWGMGTANLISIFNPEKIIFGGGIFGPALRWLDDIKTEATKWAQPISMQQVVFEPSGLQGDAAIYGAGFLALRNLKPD